MKERCENGMSEELCFETLTEFLRLRTSLDRILSPVTAQFGLTPVQTMTLHLISRSESATVGSIFREMDLNQGNVSSVCKKLESDGFIVRKKSPEDERRFVISLTEKGAGALRGIGEALPLSLPRCSHEDNEEVRRAIDGLEALKNIAGKLNRAINEKQDGGKADA